MSVAKEFPTLYKRTSAGGDQSWRIWVEETSLGNGVMCVEFGLVDGKKQTLREVIGTGKNVGRKNETSPLEQAKAEAASRWEKQKSRKGYGLTANESAEVRGASPMLAQVYEKQAKKVAWDTAFAQPKLDGFRCLARCHTDAAGKKCVTLSSRENQPMPAVAHVAKILLANPVFTAGMMLDGELYRHGLSLNQISSACKRKGELSESIEYHVYDVLLPDDFESRQTDLFSVFRKLSDERIKSVKTVKVRSESELMVCQKEFIAEGYEGAMLRHGKAGYEAGKRSSSLLKVKTFLDGEFLIVDYKMGRGKYAGMPVFVCETADGHSFDVLAPGDLEQKKALGDKADDVVGQKLTVKFQYLTKTEAPVPFLPVALGLRE